MKLVLFRKSNFSKEFHNIPWKLPLVQSIFKKGACLHSAYNFTTNRSAVKEFFRNSLNDLETDYMRKYIMLYWDKKLSLLSFHYAEAAH